MSEIDERLDRGVAIFGRAGADPALLGAALLAFHGALELALNEELHNQPHLSDADRVLLEQARLGWVARARLAEQAGLITHAQHDLLLEATRVRMLIARGEDCPWSADELQRYGWMVAQACGRIELIQQIDQPAARANATMPLPAYAEEAPVDRLRFPLMQLLLTTLFLVLLIGTGWLIYTQFDGARLLRSLGVGSTPTVVSVPEAESSPTPLEHKAQITGLSGGPGWLHSQPSFDSPTRAIQLADGMEVTLLDDQQIDSSGTHWLMVTVGGYEGWCPEHNLAIESQ